MFPTLSEVQNDTEKLREGFRRAVQLSTIVAFPMAAGIAAVAPQFVPVVLGNQWREAIPVIQILAVWGGIRAYGSNVGAVYKATGNPNIEASITALKVIAIAIIIYPAAEWFGLIGVASAVILSSTLSTPIHFYYIMSITQGKAIEFLKLIAYPLISSITMAVGVMMINTHILVGTSIFNLVLMIVSGVIFYVILMIVFERVFGIELTQLYQIVKKGI
jgi:O-antigen/teichoic acid export membrane protein